jgi:hypothetical protein
LPPPRIALPISHSLVSDNTALANVHNQPTNAQIFDSLLFYSTSHTCFDTCMSSSGSSSAPAKLHANRMQWFIRFRVIHCMCLLCGRITLPRYTLCVLCGRITRKRYTLLCVCYVDV